MQRVSGADIADEQRQYRCKEFNAIIRFTHFKLEFIFLNVLILNSLAKGRRRGKNAEYIGKNETNSIGISF